MGIRLLGIYAVRNKPYGNVIVVVVRFIGGDDHGQPVDVYHPVPVELGGVEWVTFAFYQYFTVADIRSRYRRIQSEE